jgi:hypothetical protein
LKRKKTTQVPAVDNKKKEVVRVIFPHGYIDYMITNPGKMRELSSAFPPNVCHYQGRPYQQALIDEYRAFGFAYDEKEVA